MSLALTVFAGCGDDDPSETNRCAGVSCDDGGVCDSGTGQCVNPSTCDDADACLPGYGCEGSSCEADFPCPDGVCAFGVCQAGACINPDVCQTNANCLEDYFCDDGTCAADACADVTCDRGVCEVGTGECVNDVCTSATEDTACLDGHKCDDGSCIDEATFCGGLTCDRGVCDFDALACGNADDCAGADDNCLEGSYCAADNTCQANLCVDDECDRGVCDSGTGECVNAGSCGSETDCIDAFVCVGAACVATDDACGVGGCPGNQVCNYDDSNSTAACEEDATGCETALDCLDDRVCSNGVCAAPSACSDDEFEPNNMAGEETTYTGRPMDAGICSGDQDWFLFDSATDPQTIGTMVFDVTILASDVGLGTIEIELMNPSGTSLGTATNEENGIQTNSVRITTPIDTANGGVYTAIVRDSGNVSTAGVNYTVRLDVVNDDALAACAMPAGPLLDSQAITGDTSTGASSTLTSNCADIDGLTPESIIHLPIDTAKYITITLTPLTATDLTFDVRGICDSDSSELACADSAGTSGNESLSLGLQPGDYYIVVQGASDTDNGPFAITYTSEPVICTPADNTCADATDLNNCNEFGTAFDTVTCELGCDMALNACTRPAGDDCSMPFTPTLPIADEVVNHASFTNQYDPGPAGCVPNNSGSAEGTSGPERVYTVTIPDQKVLIASLERTSGNAYGALYLVTDCDDLDNTCLAGANDGRFDDETLYFYNDTGASIDAKLIVDTQAASSAIAATILNVELKDRVCVPGETQCVLDREAQTCNDSGSGYDETVPCEFGCDLTTNACVKPTNETCSTAEVLVAGVAATGDLNQYTSDYAGVCGAGSTSGGPDALYVLQGVQAGSFVELAYDSQSSAYSIWATEDCDVTTDEMTTCALNDDGFGTGVYDNSFIATTGGDYFIGIATFSNTSTPGTYTITATVTPPACTAGTVTGCSTDGLSIEYCNASSQPDSYTCSGGCTAGACVNPTGDACFDALLVPAPSTAACPPNTPATTACGIVTGDIVNADNFIDIPAGSSGQCSLSFAGSEGESIHLFQLNAGDLLTVNMTSSDTAVFGYFMETCGDFGTCEGNQNLPRGAGTYTYFADSTKDVYFVIDTNINSTFWDYDYLLQFEVDQSGNAQCAPGSIACLDPFNLETCDDEAVSSIYACAGGCLDGACVSDSAVDSVCTTGPDVGTGGIFMFDWSDANYQSAVDSAPCSGDTDGREGYLTVTLQPTDVLSVTALNVTSTFGDDPAIRFITDCADQAGSCLAGVVDAPEAFLRYQATGTETITIVIDSDFQFTSYDTFQVTVDVSPPDCTSGISRCGLVDTTDVEVCESGAWDVVHTCSSTCTTGVCDAPDADSCFEAQSVDTTSGVSGTVTGKFDDFSSNPVITTSNPTPACAVTSSHVNGEDAYYTFDLLAGSLLTLDLDFDPLVSSTFAESGVFVLTGCDQSQCVAGFSAGGDTRPNTVSYYATTAETVTVGVARDTNTAFGSEDFELNWAINANAICQPGSTTCSDATTLQICNADGSQAETFACPHTCNAAIEACDADPVADDLCDSAVTLAASRSVIKGNWGDGFTNAIELPSGSCLTGSHSTTDGRDAIYAIDVPAGAVVRATQIHTSETFNYSQLYIFSDCLSPETTCQAGEGGSGLQIVDYFSPVAQTIYVAADGDETRDSDWTLTVDILVPDCDPSTYVQACNTDGTGFGYCDENGFTQNFACENNGVCDVASGRCEEPEGEVCLDPFDGNPTTLGTAESFTEDLDDFSNDYDLGTGNACTGSRTIGADPVYFVDLTAGQTLDVSLVSTDGSEDLAIYIVSSCDDVRSTCLAGADSAGAGAVAETTSYVATGDETVYVIVDSFYANVFASYDLDITVTAP